MSPNRKSLDGDNEPLSLARPVVWLLILGGMAAFWGSVGLWVFGMVR